MTTALLAVWLSPFALADDAAAEAKRLAEEAREKYRTAESRAEGWEPIYEEGAALAERAIALDPRSADAHYALFLNLGRKAERTSVSAQAMVIDRLKALLAKALELDPNHAHAWEAQGEMWMRLPWLLGGSEEKGEKALERAAALAPEWSKPPLRLAQYHWKKGKAEQAKAEAERARELARKARDQGFVTESENLLTKISAGEH